MKLTFTKMHGLGNDFVVLDGISQSVSLTAAQWKWLGDRHFGVGADQMLLVEAATRPEIDFRYRIFNHDGNEVEHCGNGARCFVRFVTDRGLTTKRTIKVETVNGVIELRLQEDGQVTVDMGAPIFTPAQVPFHAAMASTSAHPHTWDLPLAGKSVALTVLSMGNPHAVQVVTDMALAPVLTQGPLIEAHAAFPRRVNAGYMQIVDRHAIALRVYERGAGETLACGTGACAAVVAGILSGLLDSPVVVRPAALGEHAGTLTIEWAGGTAPVLMTGPVATVFTGEITVPDLA